ncbi:MAG: T9SS type A sorting domain-containing protein [Rhizobacter sp.]|nr:T9SS type A sorting domain-containing protein [Chlorobiales bacterium]
MHTSPCFFGRVQARCRVQNISPFFFFLLTAVSLLVGCSGEAKSQSGATLQATLELRKIPDASGGDSIALPYQNAIYMPSFEKQKRTVLNLAGEWKKQRFAANHNTTLTRRNANTLGLIKTEAAGRYDIAYNDSTWATKQLPAVENAMSAGEQTPEFYQDGVWYRKKFTVSAADFGGKFTKLMFHSVNYVADVWLNGIYLGYHEGGYTPFAFDVSEYLRTDTTNVLVLRVDNPPWGTRNDIVPYTNADWFNYTGLIHDVYLEASDPAHIIRADAVPVDTLGHVKLSVALYNKHASAKNLTLTCSITHASITASNVQSEYAADLTGAAASTGGTLQTVITVPADSVAAWRTDIQIQSCKLWSPETPNLYVLKAVITDGATVIDELCTQFGIRTIKTSGDKVLLNEKPAFFVGAARHEDAVGRGRSMTLPQIFTDLQKLRAQNVNLVRTAHYPNHLYTYLIADRLGLGVIEEIPVWWFNEAASWQVQNNSRKIHYQMWREMIFKDYNRPSILFWSTCNECTEVSNRTMFIQTARADLRDNYDDGRLVTQSATAGSPGAADASQAVCDVAGWTMYFGIFHGPTGGAYYYPGTRDFLNSVRAAYPDKPVLNTEFGFYSGESGNLNNEQVKVFNDTFRALAERSAVDSLGSPRADGFVAGTMWWCIYDWFTGVQPNGFNSFGTIRMNRTTEKPVAPALRNGYKPYFDGASMLTADAGTPPVAPQAFLLGQNYPNPFNPTTVIPYRVAQAGNVQIDVFNMLGQKIKTLVSERKAAGNYSVVLDAGSLASGAYLYRMKAAGVVQTRLLSVIK